MLRSGPMQYDDIEKKDERASEREGQRGKALLPARIELATFRLCLTLYQLSQRSFNTIHRPALQDQIYILWTIHTCLHNMRAPDRLTRYLEYLFRQRGSRHGLFVKKDVIPPDRRRRPSRASRFFTGRLVRSIRFLSFPPTTTVLKDVHSIWLWI